MGFTKKMPYNIFPRWPVRHLEFGLVLGKVRAETHIKRQETQHDCLPRWVMRKKHFVLTFLEQPRKEKNLLYQYDDNETTKKDPFHLYPISPHLPSVSTVSRGHPSLVISGERLRWEKKNIQRSRSWRRLSERCLISGSSLKISPAWWIPPFC